MLVSFGDDYTHTSEVKFIKQWTNLDLGRLSEVHGVYWDVSRLGSSLPPHLVLPLISTQKYNKTVRINQVDVVAGRFYTRISTRVLRLGD